VRSPRGRGGSRIRSSPSACCACAR
jgi:hypothetical protein